MKIKKIHLILYTREINVCVNLRKTAVETLSSVPNLSFSFLRLSGQLLSPAYQLDI